MIVTQSNLSFNALRSSVATPQSAAPADGSNLDKFQKSEAKEKKNSLWGKMGMTALGLGSVAGTVGYVLRATTGWAMAFPVCTMVGLGAGLALGAAAWAIEHKKRQEEKQAAREAAQQPAPAPAAPPARAGQPTIEIS